MRERMLYLSRAAARQRQPSVTSHQTVGQKLAEGPDFQETPTELTWLVFFLIEV